MTAHPTMPDLPDTIEDRLHRLDPFREQVVRGDGFGAQFDPVRRTWAVASAQQAD